MSSLDADHCGKSCDIQNHHILSSNRKAKDDSDRLSSLSMSSDASRTQCHDSTVEDERIQPGEVDGQHEVARTVTSASSIGPLHSVFTPGQKRFIVFMTAWAGFFSPVSASIYLPALNSVAADLNVSDALINLTLTSYMIFQGLAPSFIGNLADSMGRRPAYLLCFTIYIAANIGLALQDNYAALFVLRCLQSTGSSATIAMTSAVVSDIATPAERGSYIGFTFAGSLLGPALGPVLGGILAQFLGWRAIFWFLVIFAGTFVLIFAPFFPETARSMVGNGSIPPKGLNMSLMNYLAARKTRQAQGACSKSDTDVPDKMTETDLNLNLGLPQKRRTRFPNPLSSLKIIVDKENSLLLFYNAFLFAAFYDVTAVIPSQFTRIYGFNDLEIGLCYLPFGFGSVVAAIVNGHLIDRNFKRWCTKLNVQVKKGRDQDLRDFPIEKARLEVAMPATYVSIAMLLIFGWVLHYEGPLAVLLVVLFFASFSMTIAFNITSTLLVDFYPTRSATATAANNLVRCLLGAGATALVIPMIDGMGIGGTFTFLSVFLLVTSPMMWAVIYRGMGWREERRIKDERRVAEKEKSRGAANEAEEGRAGVEHDEKLSSASTATPELDAGGNSRGIHHA